MLKYEFDHFCSWLIPWMHIQQKDQNLKTIVACSFREISKEWGLQIP